MHCGPYLDNRCAATLDLAARVTPIPISALLSQPRCFSGSQPCPRGLPNASDLALEVKWRHGAAEVANYFSLEAAGCRGSLEGGTIPLIRM